MKTFIVVLLSISSAIADVSEIIHHGPEHLEARPFDTLAIHHPEHQEARPFDTLTINLNVDHHPEHISEAIHVEEPAAVAFGLPNEGFEIVEAIEVIPTVDANAEAVVTRVQLTEGHADYQGPYQYEKPTVQLDYGAPQPASAEPSAPVLPPTLKDQANNYLPPKYAGDNLVKRHTKYIVRRRA